MIDRPEATFDELLDDPIARLHMASHGVTASDVRQVMREARVRMIAAKNRAKAGPWAVPPQFQCVTCKAA